jgi:hypothetical protein
MVACFFLNTTLLNKLHEKQLMFLPDQQLPSKELPVPYVFMGDNARDLHVHLMKQYPKTHEKGSEEGLQPSFFTCLPGS